jgi:hypothetical protein
LQLISEAKRLCPDVVIVLGEDLTRFRNASKELYAFLRSFSWNARCERLGFDEVRSRMRPLAMSQHCPAHRQHSGSSWLGDLAAKTCSDAV